jgi:RNA polymerase sigma-70 factor (ECF subfamily)
VTGRFREPLRDRRSTYGLVALSTEKVTRLDARPPDRVLVLAARDGDLQARETLFRRHVKLAAGLSYRLLGGDDEVDDIVQDSFVTAFAKLGSLKEPQAFASWLSSIVVRTSSKRIRRRRLMRRLGLLRGEAPIDVDRLVSRQAPPDVAAELSATYRILNELPTDIRVALVLRRVEGHSFEEIASLTGASLATIKRRIAEGERRLETALRGATDADRRSAP